MMGMSRKARNIYTGFARRLDEPDLYELAIQRIADTRNDGHSSVAASITLDMIDKSRRTQSEPIQREYTRGTKVKFRIDAIDNQWSPAIYHTGRILKTWHRVTRYYLIEGEDGQRYSLPYERVPMSIDIVPVETNIIVFQAKRELLRNVAGEIAA